MAALQNLEYLKRSKSICLFSQNNKKTTKLKRAFKDHIVFSHIYPHLPHVKRKHFFLYGLQTLKKQFTCKINQ